VTSEEQRLVVFAM